MRSGRGRGSRALTFLYAACLLSAVAILVLNRLSQRRWTWNLPYAFPVPVVPADNPMSAEKVELGRRLFYDKRLSGNQTQSCASCHQQALAFTDGRAHAIGSTGQTHRRSTPSLTNVAYVSRLTWVNPLLDRLEDQARVPIFGESPVEMGITDAKIVTDRLEADADYRTRFSAAFPWETHPITLQNVLKALATFQRTLISGNAPYDRYVAGDNSVLSPSALRGLKLFRSERLECLHCHGGFDFNDSVNHAGLVEAERAFHNTGLYNIDGKGAYPKEDRGLIEFTGRPEDMGKFRAPTLRNVAVTAPYMHDGSVPTLEAAIEHYGRAGRKIETGPNAGDGAASPLKEAFVGGFILTDEEKHDVIEFLKSLTDESFMKDPRFSDPFTHS
jgi:cytochrome c peroxidase